MYLESLRACSQANLRRIKVPIIIDSCCKKRNSICFPFFHSFYLESRYCSHTVVTSLLTPIELTGLSTSWNLSPQWLEIHACHKSNCEYLAYPSDEKKNEKIQWVLTAFKQSPVALRVACSRLSDSRVGANRKETRK